ncbi:Glutathione S-transferase [Rhynchospora pubera]|uniref:glutathione transferase n=1 Tax=Rhynchospora pubera TaxID=906938 RepID=A0AAV8E5A4_9POAL|nr:Glutathione S-transferase [Rhynchospora pubera]
MILEQKGLSYEYFEENFANKSALLLKHNPVHKKVPVLIHGERAICESLVILQYIDENWSGTGPRVLPANPYDRAIASFWAAYIDDKLPHQLIDTLKAATEEAKAENIADIHVVLEILEGAFKKFSAGKAFFGGDSIGYLDVTLGSYLSWIRAEERIIGANLLDETMIPLLAEWEKRFLAADCAKKFLPSVERLEKYVRELLVTKWKPSPSDHLCRLSIRFSVLSLSPHLPPSPTPPLRSARSLFAPPQNFDRLPLISGLPPSISGPLSVMEFFQSIYTHLIPLHQTYRFDLGSREEKAMENDYYALLFLHHLTIPLPLPPLSSPHSNSSSTPSGCPIPTIERNSFFGLISDHGFND